MFSSIFVYFSKLLQFFKHFCLLSFLGGIVHILNHRYPFMRMAKENRINVVDKFS